MLCGQLHANHCGKYKNVVTSVVDKPLISYLIRIDYFVSRKKTMEKMLDSTQLVSGVAILLSFIAGYRYGVRNLEEQSKTTAEESTEKNRVSFILNSICTT